MDATTTFDVIGDFAIAAATLALTGVTVFFGQNYRRKIKLELATARLAAFGQLFEATGLAAPSRISQAGENGVINPSERDQLYQTLTTWYYQNGNGLLLEGPTRDVYLKAKHNLTCADDKIYPQAAWTAILCDLETGDESAKKKLARGLMSMRQLSLLRSQLKSELAVFGNPLTASLTKHEAIFLQACGVAIDKPPWTKAARADRRQEQIAQVTTTTPPTTS